MGSKLQNYSRKLSDGAAQVMPWLSARRSVARLGWERLSTSLVIDKSPSTFANNAESEINSGSKQLCEKVQLDALLRSKLELSVWGFGSDTPAKCYQEFVAAEDFRMPELPTSSSTWIYELYLESVGAAQTRLQKLDAEHDADSRAAWVFYFSDFLANGAAYREEAIRLSHEADEQAVNVFLIGCGNDVDERVMSDLAQPGRSCMMRSVKDWGEFFEWLYGSLRQKSMSVPNAPLQLENLFGRSMRGDG